MKSGANKVPVLGRYLATLVSRTRSYPAFHCTEMAMDNSTPSRHEKSLGLLTTKFVSLLQEAKDGVLDLKVVRCFLYQQIHLRSMKRMLEKCFLSIFVYKIQNIGSKTFGLFLSMRDICFKCILKF